MREIRRAQTEIDQLRAGVGAPHNGVGEYGDVRRECRSNTRTARISTLGLFSRIAAATRCAVADTIDPVGMVAGAGEVRSPSYLANMRMSGVHTTVEYRDCHANTGATSEGRVLERAQHRSSVRQLTRTAREDAGERRSSRPSSNSAVPSSTTRPFSNTMTRSARRANSSRCVMMIVVRCSMIAS